MKKILVSFACAIVLLSCDNDKTTSATTATETKDSTAKATVDLPYTASYTSSFSKDVPDADLKMVLVSYKDWADGNMANVAKAYADTLQWQKADGQVLVKSKADIMKLWTDYRDSLSSITIDMQAWQKMHATDKNDNWVATWYKEIDTYKSGKADSAYYHDLNMIKDGKIMVVEQYKRPAK